MKKRMALTLTAVIVVLVAIVPLQGSVAGVLSQPAAAAPEQGLPPIADLRTLLNYEYRAQIIPLHEPDRTTVITMLMGRPETVALRAEMSTKKGFDFTVPYAVQYAEAMKITITDPSHVPQTFEVDAMTVAMQDPVRGLSAALTAMQPTDGTPGFFQAHHTNLDPNLAEVPDPAIVYNGMPYFYITTLRWMGGPVPILYWHYWWYDSHNHPNWYYAHYYWYWKYYYWYGVVWYDWYWWVYGWYYWRYWYFWSTYFPWVDTPTP